MSPTQLVIVGQGTIARTALGIAETSYGRTNVRLVEVEPKAMADFSPGSIGAPPEATAAFAAIGISALNFARYDLWAKLRLAGYRCPSLVHPAAILDPTAHLAENTLVGAGAVIGGGVRVGRGSVIGAGVTVGAEAEIGSWCWLGTGVVVGSSASIGSHCVLGTGVKLADGTTVGDTSEVDFSEILRGHYPPGTFITPEFGFPGARLMRLSNTGAPVSTGHEVPTDASNA